MAKGCALSTGYLPRGGLPRNSVDRITDRPNMTSAVDRGRKASTQTNKQRSDIPLILGRLRLSKWLTSSQELCQFAALRGGSLQPINFLKATMGSLQSVLHCSVLFWVIKYCKCL